MYRMNLAKEQMELTGESPSVISVPVSITVPMTLDVSQGEDVTIAAISFARKYNLGADQIPLLVRVLEKEIEDLAVAVTEAPKRELFSISITIDSDLAELKFHEGEDPRSAAEEFLDKYGLKREENVLMIMDSIRSNLEAL